MIDTYLGNTKEKKYGRENGYGEYIKEAMAFIKMNMPVESEYRNWQSI